MPRIETEFEVVVTPSIGWATKIWHRDLILDGRLDKLAEDRRGEAEQIETEIKRHVDGIGHVEIRASETVCSHCGGPWSEDDDTYNGGCCAEDEKNNPAQEDVA